jgi:hypothetical protein
MILVPTIIVFFSYGFIPISFFLLFRFSLCKLKNCLVYEVSLLGHMGRKGLKATTFKFSRTESKKKNDIMVKRLISYLNLKDLLSISSHS